MKRWCMHHLKEFKQDTACKIHHSSRLSRKAGQLMSTEIFNDATKTAVPIAARWGVSL
jgi:hypothetical protein